MNMYLVTILRQAWAWCIGWFADQEEATNCSKCGDDAPYCPTHKTTEHCQFCCCTGNGLVYDTTVERGIRVPLWTEKTLKFFADAVREAHEKGYALYTVVRESEVPEWNFTPARRGFSIHQEQLIESIPINQDEDFARALYGFNDQYDNRRSLPMCCGSLGIRGWGGRYPHIQEDWSDYGSGR